MDAQLIPVDTGAAIQLEKDLTVLGRKHSVCDIILTSARSSKIHCMIYQSRGRLYVQDLGSANGTSVNQQRISEQTELQDNDILECGKQQFTVRLARESTDRPDHESPLMKQVLDELQSSQRRSSLPKPVQRGGKELETMNWQASVFAQNSISSTPDWMEE